MRRWHGLRVMMCSADGCLERAQVKDLGMQVGDDLEMALGGMSSLQAVSEEEWHEEVAQLSPKQLVEATFQRLFPDSFLYALPIWNHKVSSSHAP